MSDRRTRYALCGLSNRGLRMFAVPLLGPDGPNDLGVDMSEHGELVAILDVDTERIAQFNRQLARPLPSYPADACDRMVAQTAPDVVLVATPDHLHATYAVAALGHHLDVVTEKPLAATCEQVREILTAERASAGSLRVTHNVRYSPRSRQLKELLIAGSVGRVTSVELVWNVDTEHGASYFYRWHRQRALSGGLSVHKSCHHLDFVNWLIDDVPEQVFAYGALNYYGPRGQRREVSTQLRNSAYGLEYPVQYPPERPLSIYDDQIDIEDTYSAVIRYRGGASMSYSVIFSAPWEGYRLAINGTGGRIEATTTTWRDGREPDPRDQTITCYPMSGKAQTFQVPPAEGGHDGADPLLLRDLFVGTSPESARLGLTADSRQGAYAVAAGEAVWRSVARNRPYEIAELLGEFS